MLAEFELQVAKGRAAFSFKGRMVDLPVVEQARLLVAKYEAIRCLNLRRS
jgi:citrate lyase beta subunit